MSVNYKKDFSLVTVSKCSRWFIENIMCVCAGTWFDPGSQAGCVDSAGDEMRCRRVSFLLLIKTAVPVGDIFKTPIHIPDDRSTDTYRDKYSITIQKPIKIGH